MTPIPMIGVRHNQSPSTVYLDSGEEGRLIIRLLGLEEGCVKAEIDLMDLIGWLRQNKDLVMGLRETP